MKEYVDEYWCPFCKRETPHDVHDEEHERDSSNDSRKCQICGAHWMGLTDEYTLNNERRDSIEGMPL